MKESHKYNLKGPEADRIQSMFSDISSKYDKANTVLSLGIHHLWRKKLVRWSSAEKGQKVLDCATGTGDLAIEFARKVGAKNNVIGTDFCADMMTSAPEKARRHGFNIEFQTADVTKLPFEDNQFDISSISFGIRNVEDPRRGIEELLRVVQPGGSVMILEFGQPSWPGFRQMYRLYSEKILPSIGGWVTGQKEAYDYLQKSSSHFPCGIDFVNYVKAMDSVDTVEYRTLTGGIAYIYKIRKSAQPAAH